METYLQQMISDCSKELNDIENRLNKIDAFDGCRCYFTNYALIKTSGTLEYVYRSIIADYFRRFKCNQIDKYLEKAIRNASSSSCYANMCSMLGNFDDAWCEQFKQNVANHINAITHLKDGQKLISSSNSLISNRHTFAHGKNPSATFSDIKEYFNDVVTLIEILDNVVI